MTRTDTATRRATTGIVAAVALRGHRKVSADHHAAWNIWVCVYMAATTALMTARTHLGPSQGQLARRIRECGARLGLANECTKANVSRWEVHGTQPQPFYVVLLENVLGQPAEALGLHGISTDELLAGSGLDTETPVPEPSARGYGPLTGIWLSRYEYHSDSRDADLSSAHHV